MKNFLKLFVVAFFSITVTAQISQNIQNNSDIKSSVSNPDSAPVELARATVQAHGGGKFTNMKTLVVRGAAEVSGGPTQKIPASFAFVYSGEKYRIDITNPFQPLKQIYDGEQTYSSINGFSLPPLNRLGLPLLQKIDDKTFVISALEEKFKKKKGFRITSPEGYYTDFFIDEKTGQVKSYQASYEINGMQVTTSVDIDKVRVVEGVTVPENYAQRFELRGLTIYASFKAKDILVNSEVSDEIFVMSDNQ